MEARRVYVEYTDKHEQELRNSTASGSECSSDSANSPSSLPSNEIHDKGQQQAAGRNTYEDAHYVAKLKKDLLKEASTSYMRAIDQYHITRLAFRMVSLCKYVVVWFFF